MLLVLPVSRADADLASALAAHIVRLGSCEGHELLVVGTQRTKTEAEEVQVTLGGVFDEARLFIPEMECEIGWPQSANYLWRETVKYLAKQGNELPWYWFEADNTPMRKGWLDEVETEYSQAEKPFLGAVQPTRLVDSNTKEFVRLDGEHVIGTCVYPADFHETSLLWKYVRFDEDERVEPFDVYLRHEIRPQTAVAKTIHNNWRTKSYERGKDGIQGQPIDKHSVCSPIPISACVVHGCKDGSLIKTLAPEDKSWKPKLTSWI
jgi:hypothetical protein